VVSRLGFAVRPNGVLFLGKAEMLLNHAAIFDPIDLKRRFFRRVRSALSEHGGLPGGTRSDGRNFALDNSNPLSSQIMLSNPVAQIAVTADGRLAMVNHRAIATSAGRFRIWKSRTVRSSCDRSSPRSPSTDLQFCCERSSGGG
jgi:two-component system, chemotaxis family, CheB/CheR fusion protein